MTKEVPVNEQPILVEVINHVGHLTLNRPASLNTLTLSMVRTLHQQLQNWQEDPLIHAVVLRSVVEKAFCAGGDIRALYESHQSGDSLHREFFDEEYALNLFMHTFPKPIIALLNGIVLGGGMGLAQGSGVRIVTESSRLGMPEASIGFFPDVGAGYFLSRLPGELGTYLGLTGVHIGAADALYCGLADTYLPSTEIPHLEANLSALHWGDKPAAALSDMLDALPEHALPEHTRPEPPLESLSPVIDQHFAFATVPEIRQSLQHEERPEYGDWARKALQTLDSRAPTSLAVTLEHLRRSRTHTLDECFSQELTLAHRFLEAGDFMEGIRALIIDKDKSPHWNPATLDAVTPEQVARYFNQE